MLPISWRAPFAATIIFCLLFSAVFCSARQITIPISLDYQLLKALLVQSYYTGAGSTAQLVNEGDGCIALVLSEPEFAGADDVIQFSSSMYLHAGTPVGGNCLMPYQWEGSIEVAQIPRLNQQTWELSFENVDTRLYSSDGTPVESFNLVWKQMLPLINSYLQEFSIALAPPVQDLKNVILPLFTPEAQRQAEMLLHSIRPGGVVVNEQGLTATVIADAAEVVSSDSAAVSEQMEPEEILSAEELEAFVELWETWDSLLIYLISILSEQPLTEPEKNILKDLILDTRYEFVANINEPNAERDFVRDQFIEAWQQLSQIFRKYFLHNPTGSSLGYLSFITAADALMVLDELGPNFGIEISRNGLIRLARILGGETLELNYSPDLNRALQRLFEMESAQPPPEPSRQPPASEIEPGHTPPSRSLIGQVAHYLFPSACAATLPGFAEIRSWQVPKDDLGGYLDRVRSVLDFAATSLIIRKDISTELQKIYPILIPAVAWQESCFRQFVVADRKLTYLLSYNNSSVGIMQVNERVWRGIYDRQRLRWDIRYNATAGAEILDMYMQKYALKKSGPSILKDAKTLAQLVYAMYNGGPKQYSKFLDRKKKGDLYESDTLFKEKYAWVSSGAWDNIEQCL